MSEACETRTPMLTMCDYYGMCDKNGRCVGHPVKATMEYGRLLRGMREELRLVCSPCIARDVSAAGGQEVFAVISALPYDIRISGNSICKRIADKFKLFKNIRIALKNKGTIFFYQVDFFFFLYILLYYKKSSDKRLVILIYHQDFTGGRLAGILHDIYLKALSKVDAVIYTQKNAVVPHREAMWMPDFIYMPDEYERYRRMAKEDRAVVLGTMSRYKRLEELIEVWREHETGTGTDNGSTDEENTLPTLIIAGRFDSSDRYEALCADIPRGVTIRDEILSPDEYMTLLSGSRYSILPYDMEQYKSRTSGVLLESIYCGVIPIAPNELLKQNMLSGLGYDKLSDIPKLLAGDTDRIKETYPDIYREYGQEYSADILRRALCI